MLLSNDIRLSGIPEEADIRRDIQDDGTKRPRRCRDRARESSIMSLPTHGSKWRASTGVCTSSEPNYFSSFEACKCLCFGQLTISYLWQVNKQVIKPDDRLILARVVDIMVSLDLRFVQEKSEDGVLVYRLDPYVQVSRSMTLFPEQLSARSMSLLPTMRRKQQTLLSRVMRPGI